MRTNNEDRSQEKKALLLELQKMPIVQVACDRAHVGRSTYYRWRNETEKFRIASDEALHDGELLINDMTETQLLSMVKDKSFPAIHLWLRKHHPKYSDKIEATIHLKATDDPMTQEQKSLIEKALSFANIKNYGKKKKLKSIQEDDTTWMQSVINDPVVRQAVTKESFLLFFLIYFAGAIEFPLASFHREMIDLAENQKQQILVIMAFRSSGKSTIMNTAYALYSILGKKGKKFVVIMSKTKNQARIHFENIKNHLENNELLKHDLGPFKSTENDFGSYTLEIPNFGAKIISISSMQGIRGMKHGNHRPDLSILDDIEDTTSVSSLKNRDAIHKWFLSEVVPAGDRHTDIVVLGNLLHPDSLLMRLKKGIDEKTLNGTFRAYPMLDDNERVLWPGKFKTRDDIEQLKKSTGDELVWKQEYLLTISSKKTITVCSFRELDYGNNANEPKKEVVNIAPTIVSRAGYVISAPVVEDECKTVIVPFKFQPKRQKLT